MIKIGLIGYGYWGPNLARNFNVNPDFDLTAICDFSPKRLELAGRFYPQATLYDNIDDFYKSTDIDAVAIATPVGAHYELAKRALDTGRHVWVEKPMTEKVGQGTELIEIAEQKRINPFRGSYLRLHRCGAENKRTGGKRRAR